MACAPIGRLRSVFAARRAPGARRAASFAGLLCLVSSGCLTPVDEVRRESLYAEPPGQEPAPDPVDPNQELLLEQLRSAYGDGDQDLARRLVALVVARARDPRVLAVADDYRRRLDGRELMAELTLEVLAREAADGTGETVVVLRTHNGNRRPVTLEFLPVSLERRVTTLSPLGLEARARTDHLLAGLERLELPAESGREVELGRFRPPMQLALAARESYRFDPSGAWLTVDGELLPIPPLEVSAGVRVCLADFLPAETLTPEVVLDYLDDPRTNDLPAEVFLPALLERTVRVDPLRRPELLLELGARVRRWSDARIELVAPALRWLSGSFEPGADPVAWRRYFASARPTGGAQAGRADAAAPGAGAERPIFR